MHGFITLWDATSYDNWLLQVERYSKEAVLALWRLLPFLHGQASYKKAGLWIIRLLQL